MSFKDMVIQDNSKVFLNFKEFAEYHYVENRRVRVIIDDDALKKRQGGEELSIAESSVMLFAESCDLPTRPYNPVGTSINLDGSEYIVDDWQEDMGIATLSLRQNITA